MYKTSCRLGFFVALIVNVSAAAETPDPEESKTLAEVVVFAKRDNPSEEPQRRNIVDSTAAAEIAKLPDLSVTDVLQRLPGIQVARDRGEGTALSIRGLQQMETLLNGREIFTAGAGRNLDFADVPSWMLSRVEVYKTTSADKIEGGIGGTVDIRSKRPFDFEGRKVEGEIRREQGDLVGEGRSQIAAMASSRGMLSGGGEFGALFDLVYQERAWREDQKTSGNPTARTDIVPGLAVFAPNGTSESASAGGRRRTGANLVLEWRPADAFRLYAESSYTAFQTLQNSYQFNASSSPAFSAGSPVLFPGTHDLQSISWLNAPFTTYGAARNTIDKTGQAAIGGSWTDSAFSLKADLSYTESHNDLFYSAITLSGTAANLTQNLSGKVPSSAVSGTNLQNLSSFSTAGMVYAYRPFDGSLSAAKFDGEYFPSQGFIESASAGLRLAKRIATDTPGQIVYAPAPVPAMNAAGLVIVDPYATIPGSQSIGGYFLGNPVLAADPAGIQKALGITAPIPAANPLGIWNIAESTTAGYALLKFNGGDLPIAGDAGLRMVKTHETVSGNQSVSAAGTIAPAGIESSYTDYLPSLDLHCEPMAGFHLRAAASKTISRPNFDQLSPSLTINPVQLNGSAGNPALRPIRSDNLDFAIERSSGRNMVFGLNVFFKNVDGFISTVSNVETYNGLQFLVSRPQNSSKALIRGYEMSYRQVYDFLPGYLKGLGMEANFTHIESATQDSALGKIKLQNLSPNSLNLIGFYEKGRVVARLAYNWRDDFLSGISNFAGIGALPVYVKGYGWMDASFSYKIADKLSLVIEGSNLLGTIRRSFYGAETRPQSVWINDRMIGMALRLRD